MNYIRRSNPGMNFQCTVIYKMKNKHQKAQDAKSIIDKLIFYGGVVQVFIFTQQTVHIAVPIKAAKNKIAALIKYKITFCETETLSIAGCLFIRYARIIQHTKRKKANIAFFVISILYPKCLVISLKLIIAAAASKLNNMQVR